MEGESFSPLFIDVHNHAWMFTPSWREAYARAEEKRIGILATALDMHTTRNLLSLPSMPHVRFVIGVYPPSALRADSEQGFITSYDARCEEIRSFLRDDRVVGIGEIGLDGTHGIHEEDEACFITQLRIAEAHKLPVVIHSRKAEQHIFTLLERVKPRIPIILHSFTGRLSLARAFHETFNAYFSIPCIVTRSTHFQRLAESIPHTRILLETDAPFLGPKPGEPSSAECLPHSISFLAHRLGMDEHVLREHVLSNTLTAFPRLSTWKEEA